MKPWETICLCIVLSCGWGALCAGLGFTWVTASLGGIGIALLFLLPMYLAISRQNRPNDQG